MSVLAEEYLKNTRKVYNDFCNKADSYESAKDFIDNIPAVYLARYRETVLAEHDSCVKNDEAVRNFVTSVLLSALVSSLVSSLVSVTIQKPEFIISFIMGMIWVVGVFLLIYWNFIANTKKRQKYINISVLIGYLKSK
ncbi:MULTISPECIES: tRNA (guanine-N7)-methyltransferase [Streptococcus]|uniref:tRNA (guanine-N7)-methyltransferase n=1 Tax=Streptococcus TaxID=1301 RepID=UPI00110C2926|nr:MULTISPECIES: tRNA (guanine-N7)-methyltransferase [Streptococcus]TMR81722.1 tRNA (guanine-N7)-methyltransferase [Streptococcus pseudopneumoniae]